METNPAPVPEMLGHGRPQAPQVSRVIISVIILLCKTVGGQKDNGENCDCFQTNGSTSAHFLNHRFFDYRDISPALTTQPKIISTVSDPKNKIASSDYFSASSWTDDWDTQTWSNSEVLNDSSSNANVLMVYSMNNVYIGWFAYPI